MPVRPPLQELGQISSSACFVTELVSDFCQDIQPLCVPVSMCKMSIGKYIKNRMRVMEDI